MDFQLSEEQELLRDTTRDVLADFHADHPNVEITLGTDSSDALIDKVRTGTLDTAIVSVGPDERPDDPHLRLDPWLPRGEQEPQSR